MAEHEYEYEHEQMQCDATRRDAVRCGAVRCNVPMRGIVTDEWPLRLIHVATSSPGNMQGLL